MGGTEEATDWRTAKKAATRARIRDAALRLFRDQGYESTTVEQIAAAAGVTHTTFFRYFPTKEDVVLSDEYDPLISALVRDQPEHSRPAERLCAAFMTGLGELDPQRKNELLQQLRLMLGVPALRARLWENQLDGQRGIVEAFAPQERTFELDVTISAVYAATTTALIAWAEAAGKESVESVLSRAFALIRHL